MTSYKSRAQEDAADTTGRKVGGVGMGISPPPGTRNVRTQLYINESLSCIATGRAADV